MTVTTTRRNSNYRPTIVRPDFGVHRSRSEPDTAPAPRRIPKFEEQRKRIKRALLIYGVGTITGMGLMAHLTGVEILLPAAAHVTTQAPVQAATTPGKPAATTSPQ